ncbi:class II aldolase/adducin family protein [Noviherbaspirillum saxi]|uniref:Class II aldolase/adducin family protein n=1 Tax=Noviherbaspirillum saxi TaxID=2320863 RepID=A0A3A3FI80_9BURK|nr:class II aldolase/adducin family protein [Noviherbaspirillum saxi]RJF95208.1 class II aldolase/adducin family protein [Noviherbaspirillum saxi]
MSIFDEGMATRPAEITEAEWRQRLELAACYQVFDFLGWTESIFNHISVRVPGSEKHYLVNPFGLNYAEITASNLIKVDVNGRLVTPSAYGGNRAGFIIHGAVHDAREDAHCVMHTHTDSGMAVACSQDGISYDNFYGAQLFGRVAYHDFEGITVHRDEQARLLASLGNKNILVLKNHGLLVVEKSLMKAFWLMWTLQRACDVQCRVEAMGNKGIPVSDTIRRQSAFDGENFDPEGLLGQKMLEAMVRKMDIVRNNLYPNFRS